MNKLFVDDLVDRLENNIDVVNVWEQRGVRDWFILDGEQYLNFPMTCFEHTDDSNFEVDIQESKFLNDSAHKGTWIIGGNGEQIDFVLNLQECYGNILEIDVFEVNEKQRGYGLGGNIVSIIESIAYDYYKVIRVSPFDTSAMNFWDHMDYKEGLNGYWIKTLCGFKI